MQTLDEHELVAQLEKCLTTTRAIGERSASLAIEDALSDLRARFRMHPDQIAEDCAIAGIERDQERGIWRDGSGR